MKHVELEQSLHPFASRGFVSVSWAFLFYILFIGCILSCQFYNKIELNCKEMVQS